MLSSSPSSLQSTLLLVIYIFIVAIELRLRLHSFIALIN